MKTIGHLAESAIKTVKKILPISIKRRVRSFQRSTRQWGGYPLMGWKLSQATPVLIYQMGKVGSSSIYRSLSKQYVGVVLHAHEFSPRHRNVQVRRLYRWVFNEAKPLNVISLTREPISRNVSAFFQNFERDTGVEYRKAKYTLPELKYLFLSNFQHETPLVWFDNHIRTHFGIDVYAKVFPKQGIAIYEHENVRLLVLRSELSNHSKITALADFLGLTSFQLHNVNMGADKVYGETYQAFVRQVKLPSAYVVRMCQSKYFQHFYSPAVIEATRRKWSQHRTAL